jgi:transcriptional regulator with XRE-family HTH domain
MEQVRERLSEQLTRRGWSARKLALKTGYDPKGVQRWASGEIETIPASFIGACEVVRFASARWLLTGEGSPEPTDATQAEQVLGEIRRILTLPKDADDVREEFERAERADEEQRPPDEPTGTEDSDE